MEILSCKDLSFKYSGSSAETLSCVSFSVKASQVALIAGKTGSGKSTLLKLLKKEISPLGESNGEIRICKKAQIELSTLESSQNIAYVSQDPDSQIVTHTVAAELAFGLENLGAESSEILGRVGEMSAYFGLQDIYNKQTDELSGGQKQLCSLCAAVIRSPKILLLDEPVAQLDPIGAEKIFDLLRRINIELGTTIIIAEHDPRKIFEFCDKVILLDGGRAKSFDTKTDFVKAVRHESALRGYIPACARAVLPLGNIAFTVKDAKRILENTFGTRAEEPVSAESSKSEKEPAIQAKGVYFRYSKDDRDVVSGLDVRVNQGEIFAIVGSNGCGKTTMLKLLGGILKPWQGKLKIFGKSIKGFKGTDLYRENIAVLPQNPCDLFISQTVREDLERTLENSEENSVYQSLCEHFEITGLLESHPYDLSGGEIQKCAMVKLLLTSPRILLLDEPEKGLDPQARCKLGETLTKLKAQGKTVLLATHDLEFAAKYADSCGLFFDGRLQGCTSSRRFFLNNRFYTTDARRIARNVFPSAVVSDELERLVGSGGERR